MAQTTLRLPEGLYEKLKAEARRRRMTVNGFVVMVLWGMLEREGGDPVCQK